MNKKIILILLLLSFVFAFACSKEEKKEDNKDNEIQEEIANEEVKKEKKKVNPLFDISSLKISNTKIILDNKKLDFTDTISKSPLSNSSGNLLVPFTKSYELLGFKVEKNKSDQDLTISATSELTKVYIAINTEKNIKSISINNEDLSGSNISMYIVKNDESDNLELLVPLEFIAKSINSTIVKGNEENSFVLNFKEDSKEREEKAVLQEEDKFNPIFSNIGLEIGDSLDKAKEKFGEVGDSGEYQGSDYYSFDNITIFTDIGTNIISSMGIPNPTYSVDGIKPGDDIKKVFDKYGEKEIIEDKDEELFAIVYEDIGGYKIKYSLNDSKEKISFINIYEKD